jgi:Thermostable hemolysin
MFNLDYQEDGHSTGTLSLTEGAWMGRLDARPTIISIAPVFAKDSKAVEEFIIDTYARAYGAKIGVHYPILMSVKDDGGNILAALGFRYATNGPLFLEQYLSHPVEEILDTPRSSITEIGNLASSGGGASVFLFAALSAYLNGKGQTHAVITGTNFIEKRLRTLGLKPTRLAAANPDLLLHKDENWGTYYNTNPHVLAGQVERGYDRLQKVLGATYTRSSPRLLSRLHYRDVL